MKPENMFLESHQSRRSKLTSLLGKRLLFTGLNNKLSGISFDDKQYIFLVCVNILGNKALSHSNLLFTIKTAFITF